MKPVAKYFAVQPSRSSNGNDQVSPFFATVHECFGWCIDNNVWYTGILSATNWKELIEWDAANGRKVWQVVS